MAVSLVSVFLVSLSCYCGTVLALPGIQARIIKQAFDVLEDVTADLVTKMVQELQIPDHTGKIGAMSYSLTSMKVDTFSRPVVEIVITPNEKVTWTAKSSELIVKGNWAVSTGSVAQNSGSFTMTSSVFSLYSSIDTNLQLQIESDGCGFCFKTTNLYSVGLQSPVKNNFTMKGIISGLVCDLVMNKINTTVTSIFPNSTMMVRLLPNLYLNLTKEKDPLFKKSFVETFHRGEVFGYPKTENVPFVVSDEISLAKTGKMLSLGVSNSTVKSFLYQANQQDLLQYSLTPDDLPPEVRYILNTTCADFCIGKFFPSLEKTYPNKQIGLVIKSASSPDVNISDGSVSMKAAVNIILNTIGLNGEKIAEITVELRAKEKLGVRNNNLYWEDADIDVLSLASTTDGFQGSDLLSNINSLIDNVLLPVLNAMGKKGVKVLTDTIANFKLDQFTVDLEKGYVKLASHILYQPCQL